MISHPTAPGDVIHYSIRWVSEFRGGYGISKRYIVSNYWLSNREDITIQEQAARILKWSREGMLHPRIWGDGTRSDCIIEYGLTGVLWSGSAFASGPRYDQHADPITNHAIFGD